MRNEALLLSFLVAVTCWLIAASIIVINASTAYETLSPLVHSAAYLHAGEGSFCGCHVAAHRCTACIAPCRDLLWGPMLVCG